MHEIVRIYYGLKIRLHHGAGLLLNNCSLFIFIYAYDYYFYINMFNYSHLKLSY